MTAANIALVGCGLWGRNIARNLDALDSLAAVADLGRDSAAAFGKEFDCPAVPVEDALRSPEYDGAALVTNPSSHAELAVAALKAGKGVFVEKPLAMTVEEAETIAEASAKAGKPVMVGHLIRHHPVFQRLLSMVRDGAIGTLRHIRAVRVAPGRIRDEESALHDLCPHDLALVAALTGHAEPASVSCHAAGHVTEGVHDQVQAQLGFETGVTATIEANWYNPVKTHQLTVVGSEAALVFDDTLPWAEKLIRHDFAVDRGEGGADLPRDAAEPVSVPEGEPLRAEMEDFISAVGSGTAPLTGIEEALLVQRVMARMQEAIDSRKH